MAARHFDILVVGGGTGGITVAARLKRHPRAKQKTIGIIEPSDKHYYQPLWTLVGGGVIAKEQTERNEADEIPSGCDWVRDAVATFVPEKKAVTTASGQEFTYGHLVVAPGIQIDWDRVKGLKEALGKGGVCSIYAYDQVDYVWQNLKSFKGGSAIFTFPATPIKCAGAPQKIMYLADDTFRRLGVRAQSQVTFASAGAAIFGVKKYAAGLNKVIERRGIQTAFKRSLVEVRADKREAVFDNLDQPGTQTVMRYDLLHAVPPMSAPNFIKASPLAGEGGWVGVDKATLQHQRYPEVFALGDASSLPTSRTGAAIRAQAPVLVENLIAHSEGRPLTAKYDGYTSCPLVTGYGKLILAEFDYDGNPKETFPFDQGKERLSMYLLKKYALPQMYWHAMLKGFA